MLSVAIIISLIVGAGIGVAAAPSIFPQPAAPGAATTTVERTTTVTRTAVSTTTVKAAGLSGDIYIGALLPLTGDLASYGENSKVAVEVAAAEINEWFKKSGIPLTVKLVIEDTETKPGPALEKLTSMNAKGIKIVVGPQSSGEVRNIKAYADANKILLISQSSTAPELRIPDDYVFRFCPDDTIQGPATARVMFEEGIRYLVPVWRGDAWGDGLYRAAVERFKELGGNVVEGIRYAPEAKEFSAETRALSTKVSDLVDKYGADKVGVLYIAFSEAVKFFLQAREYPVLASVRWYGSDGTAQLAEFITEPKAAEFAVKTKFINPIFAATKSTKNEKLVSIIKEKLGRVPDTYAMAAYDAVWVSVLSILAVGKYDAEAVKTVLPTISQNYFGASGWVVLNDGGDRAFADYELWIIVKKDGKYDWEHVGTYIFASDSVSWIKKP